MRPPRPWLRALVAFASAGAPIAVQRYDALSKAGGRGLLWAPLLASTSFVLCAGIAAATAAYWSGHKELIDHEQAIRGAGSGATRQRDLIAPFYLVADMQRVVAGSSQQALEEIYPQFVRYTVRSVAEAMKVIHGSGAAAFRVTFVSISGNGQADPTGAGTFALGGVEGSSADLVWTAFEEHPEFREQARLLLSEEAPGYRLWGQDQAASQYDGLRLPGEPQATLSVAVRTSGAKAGLLIIDSWGGEVGLGQDVQTAQTFSSLLAAGHAMAQLVRTGSA